MTNFTELLIQVLLAVTAGSIFLVALTASVAIASFTAKRFKR